jgi:hypothetical protein
MPKPHGTLCDRSQDYESSKDIHQHFGQDAESDARERDPQYQNPAENEDYHPSAKLIHQLRNPPSIRQPIHYVSPWSYRICACRIQGAMSYGCDERHAFKLVRWRSELAGLGAAVAFSALGPFVLDNKKPTG